MKAIRFIAAAFLIAAVGCSKSKGGAMYQHPSGLFSAIAPASWRVDESGGGARRAAFYGPEAVQIAVYFYADDADYDGPADYAGAQVRRYKTVESPRKDAWKGREAHRYSIKRALVDGTPLTEKGVAIAHAGGFAVVYVSVPEGAGDSGERAYAAFLESLTLNAP